MLPETGIFNSHKGIDQILRQLVIGSLNTVGIGSDQSIGYLPVGVIDSGKIAAWRKAVRIEIRRAVDNAFKHSDSGADSRDGHKEKQDKNRFKK